MEEITLTNEGLHNSLKVCTRLKPWNLMNLILETQKELATELGPLFVHHFQQSIDTDWSLAICNLQFANMSPVQKDDRSCL